MASMTKAQMVDELEALRAELQQARGDIDFRSQAYLPSSPDHVVLVDRALDRINRMLGDLPEDLEAPSGDGESTVEPTVPPGSVGGAAAHPITGATTNVPFSKPLSEGDTRSIPGTPGFELAEMARVTRDSVAQQHAAERAPDVELTGPAAQTPVAPDGSTDEASAEQIADAHAEQAADSQTEFAPMGRPGLLTAAQAQALRGAGFRTANDIRAASDEQLDAVDGIGPETVKKLREATGA